MAAIDELIKVLSDPEGQLSLELVEEIDRQYPFFTLADAVMLGRPASGLTPDTRRRLGERLAINAPDPKQLFMLIDPAHSEWMNFYPSAPRQESTPTTDDAITTFLETYGHADPAADELLERLIFNPPAPDYLSLLEKESDPALDALATPDPSIPAFNPSPVPTDDIMVTPPPPAPADTPPPPPPAPVSKPRRQKMVSPDSSLQESLAKIYIRQRRYDKAFEIISSLSLNNPKKSIYFADQLRFLRKLMLNQQSKD